MFKAAIIPEAERITIYYEDRPIETTADKTVTAALTGAGIFATRETARKHEARGAFCQMGVCFECLVEIDGVPNRQGCLVRVKDGMRVKRQVGAPVFAPAEDK